MKKTLQKKYKLYLLAVLCTMLWGSAIPMIKIGYNFFQITPSASADQLLFAGIRFTGAGLLLLIPFFLLSPKQKITKEIVRNSTIIGSIQTAGQYFFMYLGLSYTTGVNASVFNSFGTLLYVVLAWIIFKDEKISNRKLIGCLIGFAGILLNSLATQKMGLFSLRGDGFIIISNLCVAIGFLYSKHSVKNANPFLLTGLQMTFGGGILLIISLLSKGTIPQITLSGCISLIYLIAVSAVAFSLWTLLLREYPSGLVGIFNFLTPIFGSVFSYALNAFGLLNDNSTFTGYTLLAIGCSTAGIFLSSFENTDPQKRNKTSQHN